MNDPAPITLRLLNDYQRDFPLVSRPFAAIAAAIGMDENEVINIYRAEMARGAVSRVGAVFAPRRIGASTLAAVRVPAERMASVAAMISAHREVNHNYEREGELNLWFVVAAACTARREQILADIAIETGLTVHSMPLREAYHIDLGFDLRGGIKHMDSADADRDAPCALSTIEQQLMAGLQNGLALTQQPFKALGSATGISEAMAIEVIEGWLREGIIKRFGIVVRHQELGYTANAMCVWDVPDARVTTLGQRLAAAPGVTLCYRRERALPQWRYNLYCMIHGKGRDEVLARRAEQAALLGLDEFPHAELFSLRRFKQCGARYASAAGAGNG